MAMCSGRLALAVNPLCLSHRLGGDACKTTQHIQETFVNKRMAISLLLGTASASVFAQMSPEGLWRNIDDETGKPKAEIRIVANAAGVVTGRVEKALIDSSEPLCTACTDERKGKPKVGMEIIRGAKKSPDDTVWEDGNILDPENGKTYTLRMTPLEGGKKLQVRGYIGPFYRTQIWQRIE
jgi:uncharacterized protein (DUF2147 family)